MSRKSIFVCKAHKEEFLEEFPEAVEQAQGTEKCVMCGLTAKQLLHGLGFKEGFFFLA